MAMDVGEGRGSLKAEINVTPLVDVMLVLLIIMMLLAPMLTQTPVSLPEAGNTTAKPDTAEQTVVTIDSRGHLYVNALPVPPGDLVPRVQRALGENREKPVYMKGDKDATYATIMGAMDALRQHRIDNIALITEPKRR